MKMINAAYRLVCLLMLSQTVPCFADDAASAGTGEVSESQADWATMTTPVVVDPAKPFEVAVNLKDVPADQKLAVDLYWLKTNGSFGGLLVYGPRVKAESGKAQTFRLNVKPKDGTGAIYTVAFLSPDGSWDKKTQTLTGDKLGLAGGPPPVGGKKRDKPAAATPTPPRFDLPKGITFKKSWLTVTPPAGIFREGDTFDVKIDYYLDPSETFGDGTKLSLALHGPWVDSPGGKYTFAREQHNYRGLSGKSVAIPPGKGSETFAFKVPKLFDTNSLLMIASFKDANGKNWPWSVRAAGPAMQQTESIYALTTGKPGNLFTYQETPTFRLEFAKGVTPGEAKTLRYVVTDTRIQSAFSRENKVDAADGAI